MTRFGLGRYALSSCVAAAMLAGCGSQPPIRSGASGVMPAVEAQKLDDLSGYRVLFDFGTSSGGCLDGALPEGGLVPMNGMLYGTTFGGGTYNGGTVFSIDRRGAEHVVYSFDLYRGNANGPASGLVAVNDRAYGTLPKGGAYGGGMLFSVSSIGNERTLHSFGNGSDGSLPQAALTVVNGVLYGTTSQGGVYGYGTVFGVDIKTGKERVLHSFSGKPDGREAQADLTVVNGTVYGTTAYGGAYDFGTVFDIRRNGKERVIYSFENSPDGLDPQAGVIAANGALYGTTSAGGAYDAGTVFSMSLRGTNERVLHSFGNTHDGQNPRSDLTALNGALYGTTAQGGAYSRSGFGGTLYTVRMSTGKERVLHSFGKGTDGAYPVAPITAMNGTLYGTTVTGGTNFSWCVTSGGNTLGTVFKQRL